MRPARYAEIADDAGSRSRAREREAFDRAIALLEGAARPGTPKPEVVEALRTVQKLWGFLIRDLADPDNALPERLRADLISIGLWVMREADQLIGGTKTRFDALIDVNKTVRNGLV